MPNVIEKTKELETFKAKLKGSSFDLDYSLDAIVKMSRADATFEVNVVHVGENIRTIKFYLIYTISQYRAV